MATLSALCVALALSRSPAPPITEPLVLELGINIRDWLAFRNGDSEKATGAGLGELAKEKTELSSASNKEETLLDAYFSAI